jgi:hypothetical protein
LKLKDWLKANTRKCYVIAFNESGEHIGHYRGNIPKDWLDKDVMAEVDEGDVIEVWLM